MWFPRKINSTTCSKTLDKTSHVLKDFAVCALLSGKGEKRLASTRGELTLLRDGSEKKISQQRGRIGVNNVVARNHLLKVKEC